MAIETDGAGAGAEVTPIVETTDAAAPGASERSFETIRSDIADKILAGEDADDLTKELDGVAGQNRSADGKFAAKDAAAAVDPNAAAAAAQVVGDPNQPPAVAVDDKGHGRQAPAWLPPEARDAWAKAPTAVVDGFMKRAREFESANSTLGRENKALNEFHGDHAPFAEVSERHRQVWQDAGFQHPAQAMDALMQGHMFASTDPVGFAAKNLIGDQDARAFITALAKATNTDIASLVLEPATEYQRPAPPQQQQRQQPAQIDAAAMRREIETSVHQDFETRQNQAFVDQFRSTTPVIGVNAYGENVHEFDEVLTDLSIALQQIQRSNPNLGTQDLLAAAYKKAVLMNDGARARMEAAEQDKARATSAEADKKQATSRLSQSARKAASINVTGSPNRNPAPVNVRSLQDQALDEMGYAH